MPTWTDLDRLAARLARSVSDGRREPSIVGVPSAGPPLVVPLGGQHPVEALQEVRAAACWEAVVVVSTGRVVATNRLPPASAGRAAVRPEAGVVVATVTSRQGEDRSVLLGPDGRVLLGAEAPQGLVPDAARRVLGRATAPPTRPVTTWWAVEWLADVVSGVLASPTPLGLEDAVSLHPAVEPDDAVGPLAAVVHRVIERGWDHAAATGWEAVRCSVADGLLEDPWCPAPLAGWYDAGSFSRYAEAARPSAASLLAALRPLLDPAAAEAVQQVLEGWDLVPAPPVRSDQRGGPR